MHVGDAETTMMPVQVDTGTAEHMGLMTREPEETVQEMMGANGNSLSDLAISENGGWGR